jgi:hypothetical protein
VNQAELSERGGKLFELLLTKAAARLMGADKNQI